MYHFTDSPMILSGGSLLMLVSLSVFCQILTFTRSGIVFFNLKPIENGSVTSTCGDTLTVCLFGYGSALVD